MENECTVKDHFELHEKLLMRGGFGIIILLAFLAILRHEPSAAFVYLAAAMIGGLLVVYRFLCVYCPYPYHFSDCLFIPYQAIKGVAKKREGECDAIDKAGTLLVTLIIVVFPQYWLFMHPWMAITFWVVALAFLLVFPLYYCKRCRHRQCMANRA